MKKFVQKRLLPLLFSLSLCFFGSLNAKAYEFEYLSYPWFSSANDVYYGSSLDRILDESYKMTHSEKTNVFTYEFTSSSALTFNSVFIGNEIYDFLYPYDPTRYTYKFVGAFVFDYGDFNPDSVKLNDIVIYNFSDRTVTGSSSASNLSYETVKNTDGVYFNFNFDLPSYSNLSVLEFKFNPAGIYTDRSQSRIKFTGSVVAIPIDTSAESANAIVKAIQDQTDDLNQAIDESTEDIQQSIEDQYGGDPSEELDVDSIISNYDEKMGVLTFGSDVMIQFLDMFQSANVGTAELTLPGFNITVENVEYSVWPDYSFNFEQLNEWVPALMSVIRIMLPAFVWLMVLRYCIKVFEDNFLSK